MKNSELCAKLCLQQETSEKGWIVNDIHNRNSGVLLNARYGLNEKKTMKICGLEVFKVQCHLNMKVSLEYC